MFVIFTGNGKGKTTAALGQAVRAVGNGKKVLMVQFIKGPWESGEETSMKRLAPDFLLVKKGKGFVGIGDDTLPIEVHQKAAREGLMYARSQALTRTWDVIILDEIWNVLRLKLISPIAVQDTIDLIHTRVDYLIATGRDCPQEFIDSADLVTEMKEVKHPFMNGVKGRKGLEY